MLDALRELLKRLPFFGQSFIIGMGAATVEVSYSQFGSQVTGRFEIGDYRTAIDFSSSATGTLTWVKNAIAKLDDVVVHLQQRCTETETEIEQKTLLLAKLNPQVDEYHQK